jgi:hypothetical protein
MATSFDDMEWRQINDFLDSGDNSRTYGIPDRIDTSVVFASWNIRKLGALRNTDGSLKKSAGATEMLARFCRRCDLIAVQEVQEDTAALMDLVERLNDGGASFDLIMSDVTGKAPGYEGMAERSAFVYNAHKVRVGRLASDLSLDRTAVIKNVRAAYSTALAAEMPEESSPNFVERALKWITDIPRIANMRMRTFVQFIRSPHLVEFIVQGSNGSYEIHCVNAHLVSGESKVERAQEFFALLEWLLLESPKSVGQGGKIIMILADLNLDFESSADKRRRGVEEYVTSLNSTRNLDAKVNFPFLDGPFFTNARGSETYDHIAYIADDIRWPRGRHNGLAGTLGADQFDYGMFDFARAFVDAGPGRLADGKPAFEKFTHDFTDHMPIWLRMPLPSDAQHTFHV